MNPDVSAEVLLQPKLRLSSFFYLAWERIWAGSWGAGFLETGVEGKGTKAGAGRGTVPTEGDFGMATVESEGMGFSGAQGTINVAIDGQATKFWPLNT